MLRNFYDRECFDRNLFGLPPQHMKQHNLAQRIQPGHTRLFLFNDSDKFLHGVFEAIAPPMLNIEPYAWTLRPWPGSVTAADDEIQRKRAAGGGGGNMKTTRFSAQVRVRLVEDVAPLEFGVFKDVVNLKGRGKRAAPKHWLNPGQVSELIALFRQYSEEE